LKQLIINHIVWQDLDSAARFKTIIHYAPKHWRLCTDLQAMGGLVMPWLQFQVL